jgi:hypothetical protein
MQHPTNVAEAGVPPRRAATPSESRNNIREAVTLAAVRSRLTTPQPGAHAAAVTQAAPGRPSPRAALPHLAGRGRLPLPPFAGSVDASVPRPLPATKDRLAQSPLVLQQRLSKAREKLATASGAAEAARRASRGATPQTATSHTSTTATTTTTVSMEKTPLYHPPRTAAATAVPRPAGLPPLSRSTMKADPRPSTKGAVAHPAQQPHSDVDAKASSSAAHDGDNDSDPADDWQRFCRNQNVSRRERRDHRFEEKLRPYTCPLAEPGTLARSRAVADDAPRPSDTQSAKMSGIPLYVGAAAALGHAKKHASRRRQATQQRRRRSSLSQGSALRAVATGRAVADEFSPLAVAARVLSDRSSTAKDLAGLTITTMPELEAFCAMLEDVSLTDALILDGASFPEPLQPKSTVHRRSSPKRVSCRHGRCALRSCE